MEKGVSRKNHFISAIFHIPTDTIHRMTRSIAGLDFDITNVKRVTIFGCLGDPFALMTTYNWHLR